jgi:putative membrane protein
LKTLSLPNLKEHLPKTKMDTQAVLNKQNDKTVFKIVLAVSALICVVVVVLNQKLIPVPDTFPAFIYKLPMLNAILNGSCSVLLIASLWAIKKRNIELHKKLNLTAFLLSSLFLISYVTAHYFIPDTKFGDVNHNEVLEQAELALVSGIRPIYIAILLSHIFLAVIVLPMILLSFYYALKDDRVKHKKITRFSYPIWLYVTITGVVVYAMISPYYNY